MWEAGCGTDTDGGILEVFFGEEDVVGFYACFVCVSDILSSALKEIANIGEI